MILCGAIQGVKSSVRINIGHLTFVFSFSWLPPILGVTGGSRTRNARAERSFSGCRVCQFHHGDVGARGRIRRIERGAKPRVMPLEPDRARTGEVRPVLAAGFE